MPRQRSEFEYIHWVAPMFFVIVVGVIGSLLLFASHAATPNTARESETGTVSSCATKVSDSTASNNGNLTTQAVKFGGCSFVHPGIFLDRTQLELVKNKLIAKANPWTSAAAFLTMTSDPTSDGKYTSTDGYHQMYNSLSYAPHAQTSVSCSGTNAVGGNQCKTLESDANAAYTQALLYYYDLDGKADQHAQLSIKILNAWASSLSSLSTSENQLKLESSWAIQAYTKAAEIMRYTYTPPSGETKLNSSGIAYILTNKFLPIFSFTSDAVTVSNGNWRLTITNAVEDIAVFTDNHTVYNQALAEWRAAVPPYLYVPGDGALPQYPPGGKYTTTAQLKCYWAGAGTVTSTCPTSSIQSVDTTKMTFVNGMTQETCRDPDHVSLALAGMFAAAETARIQGTNLWQEQQSRLVAGLNFTTAYNSAHLDGYGGTTVGSYPTSPCGGPPWNTSGGNGDDAWQSAWETAYATLHVRMGLTLSDSVLHYLQTDARKSSNSNGRINTMSAWETVTSPLQ